MYKISEVEFSLLSPAQIRKLSVVEITRPELYDADGYPVEHGIVDPRMGVIDPGVACRTCGYRIGECMGHFGHIELVKPVVHPVLASKIYMLLQATCEKCGRILAPTDIKGLGKCAKNAQEKCPYCGEKQKKVKFVKPTTFILGKKELTAEQVREWLEKIADEDLERLNFKGGRPEWMIITILPVPPMTMRPSIVLETGERSEDDLTHKLVDIVRINERLKRILEIGAPDFLISDIIELLQYHVATYIKNDLANVPPARHRSGRPLKTLAQRLTGKEGRFRFNLTGKRVNFSARSVISPDNFINLNEVGVPKIIAKTLTIPERVTENNIEEMKKLVLNADKYPGANYVIRTDGLKKKITKETKQMIAEEIIPGYVVERHLQDGDWVIFNRQPSLHRMSMMAHKVKVMEGKTFRLHLAVTTPYNADFDGDEMNLHVPQTEEARAELKYLMDVNKHIRSPRYGLPIIGAKNAQEKCPYCGEKQKKVKFVKPTTFILGKKELTAEQVREWLEKIADEDLERLNFKGGRPEWMIITILPVPPMTMRPSIVLETGERSEDDLTHKLVDIVRINERLKRILEIGAPDFLISDIIELLQYHVATYIKNDLRRDIYQHLKPISSFLLYYFL